MTLAVQNTDDIKNPWTRWFIAGETGSGKTACCSTFPDPLFIVPKGEGSMVTLMGKKFDFRTVGNIADTNNLLDQIEAEYNKDPAKFPYMTIVMESLSHYCDLVIEDLTKGNKFQMDQQRWGILSSHLRSLHQRLSALDVHVVFTSLVKVEYKQERDGSKTPINGGPILQGQMAFKLPSACDIFALCEVKEGKPQIFEMHFTRRNGVPARTRFKRMPAKVTNFNFDEIEQYLTLE